MSTATPATAPPPPGELEYVGFWPRFVAQVVDTLWLTPLIWIVVGMFQNASPDVMDKLLSNPAALTTADIASTVTITPAEFLIEGVLPAVLIIIFWIWRGATPGKMLLHARIVDASTGGTPTKQQFVIRYVGYIVCFASLGVGFLWVGWDPRKQGWHDKLANTVVVRPKFRPQATVSFPGKTQR